MADWWAWVQRHLDERGWTSSDLARHAKINRSIIGRWRDGAQPEVRTARALAVALGRPVLEVLVAAELLTAEEAGVTGVTRRRLPLDPVLDSGLGQPQNGLPLRGGPPQPVSREYVRRIPGLRAGYPVKQVIDRLVHLGRSREDAEAAVNATLRED